MTGPSPGPSSPGAGHADPRGEARRVPAIQRAAIAVLAPVRLEVDAMRAEADAAVRDRDSAGRSADAQRDTAERAIRLDAEATGAERVLRLLGILARG